MKPEASVQKPRCQVCGRSNLERVLDLGMQPLCNDYRPLQELNRPQVYYPLALYYCPDDDLVQLGYVLPTKYTFGQQYSYLTGSSKSLVEFYSKLAHDLVERFNLRPGDAVIEIGCNDGTFLRAFQSLGITVLGVEGAEQPLAAARAAGIPVLPRFFGRGLADEIKSHLPTGARLRLVAAMSVLAHTDNLSEFLTELSQVMDPETVFVSQSHWLVALIRNLEFDTIYHEHLKYYSLRSLMSIMHRHALNTIDAQTTEFYGGAILVYATKQPAAPLSKQATALLEEEQSVNVVQSLKAMQQALLRNRFQLLSLLFELKQQGQRVVGIGAPMKASTLLNYYGITADLLEYLAEVNPLKIGMSVPGVHIPVVDEEVLFHNQPDYALLMTWNMASDIIPKLQAKGYRGRFILPIPEVKVLNGGPALSC